MFDPDQNPDRRHPGDPSRRALLKTSLGLIAGVGGLACATASRALAREPLDQVLLHAASSLVPAPTMGTPTLIVAGGPGTGPTRWAPRLAPSLEETLSTDGPIIQRPVIGQDGVTGANLFDAQTAGDSALLAPGSAIIAALAGDTRVHFDFQRWVPVLLAAGAPLIVGHVDFRRSLRTMIQNTPVRVAVTTPTGGELPALVAMAILSMRVIPVSGFAIPTDSIAALRKGAVDVIQLSPVDVTPELLGELQEEGFVPLFTLAPSPQGDIPDFATRFTSLRGRPPSHPLWPAYRALAQAASIDAALVLPMLTSAASTARWRHAAAQAAMQPSLVAAAKEDGTRLVTETDIFPLYSTLTPGLSDMLALRRWLAISNASWRTG